MLKYSHPTLALILDYWPITIFMPAILVLIATLALITRAWDRRDQEAREAQRPSAQAPGAVVSWQSGLQRSPPGVVTAEAGSDRRPAHPAGRATTENSVPNGSVIDAMRP
jgi:hypothetical protein